MAPAERTISLGFASKRFPPGIHVCQIFSDDAERDRALLEYACEGLEDGERVSCFTDKLGIEQFRAFLAGRGVSWGSGALALSGHREVYVQDGGFDPDRLLSLLRRSYTESMELGYPASRAMGEMTPEVLKVPGGSRLLEYECRVSLLQRECPFTAVCQYDSRSFDGAFIMDVLKVHPFMVVRGQVVQNPFFVAPEKFLAA